MWRPKKASLGRRAVTVISSSRQAIANMTRLSSATSAQSQPHPKRYTQKPRPGATAMAVIVDMPQ